MPSTIDRLLTDVGRALTALPQLLAVNGGAASLLASLGWSLPPGAADIGLSVLDVTDLAQAIGDLDDALTAGTSGLELDVKFAAVAVEVAKAFDDVRAVLSHLNAIPDYLAKTDIEHQLLPRLSSSLLAGRLGAASPFAALLAQFTGVLTVEMYPADPSIYQVQHVRPTVHWDALGKLFTDPAGQIAARYGWGTAHFDGDSLVTNLSSLVELIGLPARVRQLPRRVEEQLAGGPVPDADVHPARQLVASLVRGHDSTGLDVGLSLYPLRASSSGGADGGLGLSPFVFGTADVKFPLSPQLTAELDATVALDSGLAVQLRPGQPPKIKAGLLGAGGVVDGVTGRIYTLLTYAAPPHDPTDPDSPPNPKLTLLTLPGGGLLEADSVTFGGGVDVGSGAPAPEISAALSGGHVVIRLGDDDSFLGEIIPGGIEAHFDVGVRWSGAGGFHFTGAVTAGIDLPVTFSLGGFELSLVHVEVGPSATGLTVELSASGGATLGPLGVACDRVGALLEVAFQDGNLGPIDVALGFKAPSGIGLSVDSAAVTGGGFLEHVDNKYEGAFELTVCGVAVSAYGLIENQASGYSALIVISATFSPGLQLGDGFTLDGVGGLVGINRTLSIDNVQAAIWSHHFDGLLFPKDPIAAAPALMSAIERYFPAASGRYLFGPLAKIGWGGGLLEALVGLLVEVPEPIRILLIGEVDVQVPKVAPQLILHLDFDGGIDFGQKLAFFDASLHDSKVGLYPLSGDLAFRYGWGDAPVFALAIGGFNPHYQPPANFPTLKRVAIAIGEPGITLTAQAYLALTSNTLQFGAKIELTAGASALSVHGWLGFDALVEWDPFAFTFDISAGVDLRSGSTTLASVHLDGTVSGTSPWHVSGDASLSLLFFDISVHFDKQWGDTADALPADDPTPAVSAALRDPSAWSSTLPATAQAVITAVSSPGDAAGALLLDPAGALRVAQRVAPLGHAITRFNGAALAKPITLSIDAPNVFGDTSPQATTEEFAVAQFQDLSDAQKLSLPSFTRLAAGIEIGADQVDLGASSRTRSVVTSLAYDTTIIDSTAPRPGARYVLSAAAQAAANARLMPFPTPPPRVRLAGDSYVIAGTADLAARADIPTDGTKRGALSALAQYLAAHPDARDQLQIVLSQEAA